MNLASILRSRAAHRRPFGQGRSATAPAPAMQEEEPMVAHGDLYNLGGAPVGRRSYYSLMHDPRKHQQRTDADMGVEDALNAGSSVGQFMPSSGVGPGTRGYRGSYRNGGYNYGYGTGRPEGEIHGARSSDEYYAMRDEAQGNPLDNIFLGSPAGKSLISRIMAEARGEKVPTAGTGGFDANRANAQMDEYYKRTGKTPTGSQTSQSSAPSYDDEELDTGMDQEASINDPLYEGISADGSASLGEQDSASADSQYSTGVGLKKVHGLASGIVNRMLPKAAPTPNLPYGPGAGLNLLGKTGRNLLDANNSYAGFLGRLLRRVVPGPQNIGG